MSARALKQTAWLFSPATLLLALLMVTFAHTAWILSGAHPDHLRVLLGNLIFFPICLLAAGLTFSLSRRLTGRPRRTWQLFTAGILSWGFGQVIYTALDLTGRLTFPSLADLGYLLLIPCFLAGLLFLPRARHSRLQSLSLLLDVAIIVVAVGDVLWHSHLQALFNGYAGDAFSLLIGMAYPAFDLLLIAVLVTLLVWRPRELASPQMAFLGAGLTLFFAADNLYTFASVQGIYHVTHPMDSLWTFGITSFGVAAYVGLVHPRLPRADARADGPWPLHLFVPSTALILAYSAFFLTHTILDAPLVDRSMIIVSLLVVIRQFLSLLDNRRLTQALSHQAQHDPLTGLLNRSSVHLELNQKIQAAQQRRAFVGVLFVDLDGMKYVNDAFAHAVGDQVLLEVAHRLRRTTRPADTIARLGGDEFLVAVDVDDTQQLTGIAQRLRTAVAAPIQANGHALHVTASIGIVICPVDAQDAAVALHYADLAMYQAKTRGKNRVCFYNPEHHESQLRRTQLEEHLRDALKQDALELHYQPIVQLPQASPVGFEALLRWHSPTLGPVSPLSMVQVAEERGLMPELGAWVLNHALQHAKVWRQHHAGLYVSVNVSATQFALADFVQQVQGALDLHQVPGEVLVLELTESTLIGDADASVLKMRALKELGVRIALDDFGTGYSSLSYLRQLPVDLLKIDQSFIRTLRDGGASFVRAIVTLAHDQGVIVVAEGVEEAWQADVLSHLKCNLAQGYLFAKPLPFSQAQHYALSASPTPEAHS